MPQCSDFMRPVGKVTKGCVIRVKDFFPKAVFLSALSFHGGGEVLLSGSVHVFNFLRQVIQLACYCRCVLHLIFPSLKM